MCGPLASNGPHDATGLLVGADVFLDVAERRHEVLGGGVEQHRGAARSLLHAVEHVLRGLVDLDELEIGRVVGVLGAVAGAVIGNAIERSSTREDALEITVQLRNGERRSIVQAKGAESFNSGDPVILTTTGGKTRVMRAPAVVPTAPNSNS